MLISAFSGACLRDWASLETTGTWLSHTSRLQRNGLSKGHTQRLDSAGRSHDSLMFPVLRKSVSRLHRQSEFIRLHICSVGSSRVLLRRVHGPNLLVPLSAVPPASAPGYDARLVQRGLSLGADKSFGQKREPGLSTGALPAHLLMRMVRVQGGLPICPSFVNRIAIGEYESTFRVGACLDAIQA